jgi:hypothetical protein
LKALLSMKLFEYESILKIERVKEAYIGLKEQIALYSIFV